MSQIPLGILDSFLDRKPIRYFPGRCTIRLKAIKDPDLFCEWLKVAYESTCG